MKSCRCQLWIWRTIYLAEGIWKVHIFRHLFVCFQTSVYTLGEFHQNRNNSTVFEEFSVSIVDLTDYFLLAEGIWKVHIFRHLFVCFQTIVYTLGEFHQNRYNSAVFEEMSVSIVDLTVTNIRLPSSNPQLTPPTLQIQYCYSLITMQFVCIGGFDWLLFYVKFPICKS